MQLGYKTPRKDMTTMQSRQRLKGTAVVASATRSRKLKGVLATYHITLINNQSCSN